ncbi:hypothetical protein PM10SUCC1_02480 [Propionigenium maris DSM 9537]|uniref:Metallo-beta-lactamase domain-containing protein n=1 Tax=Propionigenium maris DSM 9537 TaxID=1123000 RepID=A0A9W6GIF6_9FUSO|nr:MBL fold metallo-hydrolase [Propionigenium maris]GLI54733.1 hypothetical protein PM10SUCC1_02480 [Propionigenium maris DSM 9537]
MKIEVFPAEVGDSFLISYGEGESKHILIDGGYRETYDDFLKDRLKEIKNQKQEIELLIVTHIDQDHILGILSLFEENGTSDEYKIVKIREIWHNSYKHLHFDYSKDVTESSREFAILDDYIATGTAMTSKKGGNISAYQGSMLASYILENKYNWNMKFDNEAIIGEDLKRISLSDDLNIIVISPYKDSLERLAKKWRSELKRRKINFEFSEGKKYDDAFEFFLLRKEKEVSTPYKCSFSKEFDISKIEFPAIDRREANESSIAVIIEYKNKKSLFLGDANPNIITKSLTKLKEKENYNLFFDVIKMSHHGSLTSTTPELLSLVDGENWIFSGNGYKNKPGIDLIKLILLEKKQYFKRLVFNHEIEWLRNFENESLKKEYNYEILKGCENKSTLLYL